MDQCDVILQVGRKAALEAFWEAKVRGMSHPVIVLCPVDVYRSLRPGGRDPAADALQTLADEAGGSAVTVVVEDHAHLYEGLRTISPGAAEALDSVPDPDKPFRIVVITRGGSRVVSEPLPDLTFGRRVFRSCRERVEVEYLKAVRRVDIEPVVMVDARGQEERRRRLEGPEVQPGGLPKVHVAITVGSRSQIAREVAAWSRRAGEEIASGPPPELPFTVVVVTGVGVEVFNEPEPE